MSFFKHIVLLFVSLLFVMPLHATHQKAAEISFEYVSGYTYRIKVVTYTFTESEADRPELEILWGDGQYSVLPRSSETEIEGIQTKINIYYGNHTYSGPGQYYISIEDPNRNGGVVNMPNSINTPMYVETLLVISPYMSNGNNSPILLSRPVDDKACVGRRFVHNPGAYDKEGDSLSYKLIECKTTNGEPIVGYSFPAASDTFYINSRVGDLVWENPIEQGEYNVAILIQEWRNQRQVSEITRDMQIVVQTCDNWPPDIFCEEKYCVEAGNTLRFDMYALDQDNDQVKISANSEILDKNEDARIDATIVGDSSSYFFVWNTKLSASRKQPYTIYLKATDNGEPNLSDLKTVSVYVLAPSVKKLGSTYDLEENDVKLQWQRSQSPHAIGYNVYRRKGPSVDIFDSCRSGVEEGYVLISTLKNIADTSYIDRDSLVAGMQYCYTVCAYFADGSESYPSDQSCIAVKSYIPVFTKISVNKTDKYKGSINLSWRNLKYSDTIAKEYKYILKKGHSPEVMEIMGYYSIDSTNIIIDTNLNTVDHPYYYNLGVISANNPDTNNLLYQSMQVSSIYLTAVEYSRRAILSWSYNHPWDNTYFLVYRKDPGEIQYKAIKQVKDFVYEDTDLENGEEYSYYVEAYGTYYSDQIEAPLINLSNEISVEPKVSDPCKPYVFWVDSSCFPLSNTIIWSFDSSYIPDYNAKNITSVDIKDCYTDVNYYKIYYKRLVDKEYEHIATTTETNYYHENPLGYFSCYKVSSVDVESRESELSEVVYADNRNCFSYKLPNVFTPNGDGANDVFRALPNQYVEGFKIRIFNRWGGPVYTSNDPKFEWNGKTNGRGEDCADGVYFYVVEFTSISEGLIDTQYQGGSVTILR